MLTDDLSDYYREILDRELIRLYCKEYIIDIDYNITP